jgi:hypothetical protein
MARQPSLIVEVARGGAVDRQLRREPPPSVASGEVAIVSSPADAAGKLDAPSAGEVVMSLLSPEALVRERDQLRRVVGGVGVGEDAVVVVIEAAEELREEELAAALDAASHSDRAVILRVVADG